MVGIVFLLKSVINQAVALFYVNSKRGKGWYTRGRSTQADSVEQKERTSRRYDERPFERGLYFLEI